MKDYKKDFPILSTGIAYLDNSATTQRPKKVIDAVEYFMTKANANPLRGLYELAVKATDCYEDARDTVRKFINASSVEEIIFTRNTTESINLVAYSYGLTNIKKDDEIVVAISEHHSNFLPWQMVAKNTGATLKYLYCNQDGSYNDDDICSLITPKTKLVAIAYVSNVTGRINPVEKIISRVHSFGGVVLVDGAQSISHMPTDVSALDADFFAFSAHKMYGPMGVGVLYGKKSLLENMPPFLSGGEMIESVSVDGATFAPLPHKFEAGTVNADSVYGLKAAIEYINEIGFDNITKREHELTEMLFNGLSSIPHVNIIGGTNAASHLGIVSFTIDGVHPHDIAAILDNENVYIRAGHHCAQPLLTHLNISSSARASIAFYNDESDIQRLVNAVSKIRSLMGYEQ